MHKMQPSSSRILYDIPCKVCRDHSSGKHYGIFACDGCAGFFKRSIRRNRHYVCKSKSAGSCTVDKTHRNQCRACRLAKCIRVGMNKDAVQHERGPRNATIRRQIALYMKRSEIPLGLVRPANPASVTALDLALPKSQMESRVSPVNSVTPPHHHHHSTPVTSHFNLDLCRLAMIPVNAAGFAPFVTSDSPCEQAAQILFVNVRWAKDLAIAANISTEDQLILLEYSWRDLFLLSAGQLLPNLDPTPFLPPGPHNLAMAIEIARFRDTLVTFHTLNLDPHEFSCLKSLVLLKNGLDCDSLPSSRSSNGSSSSPNAGPLGGRLRDPFKIMSLRDSFHLTLGRRLSSTPYGALRFGKLMMLMPALKSVSANTIEELFFKQHTAGIPIERLMGDMYRSA